MTARHHVWLSTVRRLLRAPWVRRAAAVLAVATALLVLSLTAVSAWSLSRTQVAQRDLGRFDVRYASSITIPPGGGPKLSTVDITRCTPQDLVPVLTSSDVKIAHAEQVFTSFTQTDWRAHPFPGITLVSGRWPRTPGEVLLTQKAAAAAGPGHRLDVLSGRAHLTVVGVADDAYSSDAEILAAPGTWQLIPAGAARARQGLGVQVSVLAVDSQRDAAAHLLRRIGVKHPHAESRQEVQPQRSWIAQSPYAFTVPMLVLPLLSAAGAVGSGHRRYLHFVRTATAVGASRNRVLGAVAAAYGVVIVIGIVAGTVCGTLLGLAARVLVASRSSQATGPFPDLLAPVALIAASALTGVLLALAGGRLAARLSTSPVEPESEAPRWVFVRRWGAAAVFCAAGVAYTRISTATSAMVFGALITLGWIALTPELIRLAIKALPTQRPGARLVKRLLTTSGGGPAIGTALMTVLLTLPLSTALLLGATGATQRSGLLAAVGPGQVGVYGRGGNAQPAPPSVAEQVVQVIGAHDRSTTKIQLHTVYAWYEVPTGNSSVLAVDDVSDVPTLLGAPLSHSQRETLAHGGMLIWQNGYQLKDWDFKPVHPQPPMASYQPDAEWKNQFGAVMLVGTARHEGLRVEDGAIILAGVSPAAGRHAQQFLRAAGLDPELVHLYHAPDAPVPPTPLIASALTLVLLLIGASFVANSVQAASMRRQMQRIIAIGASRRFVRSTYLINQAVTTGIALVSSLLLAVATTIALTSAATGVDTNPPVLAISACLVAFLAAGGLSTSLATKNLRAAAMRAS